MKKRTLTHSFFLAFLTASLSFSSFLKAAPTAPASTETQAKDNPGSLPILLGLDHVARDLHLTSLQKTIIGGLRSDYRAAALKITQTEHATAVETALLQLKLDHLADYYNDRALAVLNRAQRHRLREIERQMLGGTLLTSPSEQELLGMSEAQKQKIAQLHQESEKKAAAIQHRALQGKMNYHQQIMALRKNRQHYAAAMLKVLNSEQLQKWREVQGRKLVF